MKNIILLLVMIVGLDYVFKQQDSVYVSNTSISSDDRYYEELRVKRMSRALVVKSMYSKDVIVSNQ